MANSTARAVIDVGSVIADTYLIEGLLGRGGMGAVFLASHRRLAGKRVAIKILHTEIDDADIVARFKREAEIAARLNHPNIVGVIDYNIAPDGTPYLVLDYLEGETLAQRIARGPMPLEDVIPIVRQVGSALAAAHRAGIVHRDLKPQNIFLVASEIDGRHVEIAKVLDFGISKIRGSQTVKTQDSALLGTPQYMAPEQATGQHASVDDRTDVFALGAIVYEMLCGQPAFSGASIPEVVFKVVYEQPAPLAPQVPSLPPTVANAVAQAMAKPSEQRFPSVAGFVEAVTGQPLTLTRGQPAAPTPAADAPSAARRVASGEALAQTMGSGDFSDAPIDPLLATAVPGGPPTASKFPASATAAGSPGARSPVAAPLAPGTASASGGPAMSSTGARDMPSPRGEPARRRSGGLIAAIAIAAAAAAGGAIYMATRSDSSTQERARTADRQSAGSPRGPDGTRRDPRDRAAAGGATVPDRHGSDSNASDSKVGDPKAGDTKTGNSQSGNSKPGNSKSGDSQTANSQAGDSQAGGSETGDSQTASSKTGDSQASDSQTASSKTGDSQASDSQTANSKAGDSDTGGSKAGDSQPANSKTGDSQPGDSQTANSKAGDSQTGNPKTGDSQPGGSKTGGQKAGGSKIGDAKAGDATTGDSRTGGSRPGSKTGGSKTGDAKAGKPDPGPTSPGADDDVEGDADVRQKLKQAAAALDRRDYDQAERIANSVINAPATPRQHATARMIHGVVQCAGRNDLEAASIDLRSLARFRALRTRLLSVCGSHGIVLSP